MAPTFVSPNNWPIFDNWLMVAKDGFRYVILKDGQGLRCHSTRHLRVVELTDSSDKAAKALAEKEIDYVCTESAISKDEAFSDKVCQHNLEFFIPLMQDLMLSKLPKGARLLAILGRFPGEGMLKASGKGSVEARLTVTVGNVIKVPAAFRRVRHRPKGRSSFVPHSSTVDEQSLRAALALANAMLQQAAIKVEIHSFDDADVEEDLGTVVDLRKSDGPEVLAIRARHDKSVEPNVFVVGRVVNNSGTTGSTFDDRDVIVDDHESGYEFARTLAHELGHVFGLGHVWPDPKKQKIVRKKGNVTTYEQPSTENLMGPGDEEGLNKGQIERMRKRAQRLAGSGKN